MVSLVTGAAGFIGSHVADSLVSQGHRVVGLDDFTGGVRDNCPAAVQLVSGSVLDAKLLADLFATHRFDYVYHLAAYAAEGLSHFIRRFNYANNVIGSMNVINESINTHVKCLVFTSSIAVYGAGRPPFTEAVPPEPEDPYGIAKYAVELDLKAAHRMFGLNSIVFRPHNVYGERQHIGDRYRNVIGIFMNQIMMGRPMTIFGDGSQTRAFTYIGDVAPVIAASVNRPAAYDQTFNIGADEATSLSSLSMMVAEAMGVPVDVQHLDARQEVVKAIADHSKIREVLGYSPQWSIQSGLGRMAAWAKRIGPRAASVFGDIEVYRNLPKSWLP